MEIDSQQKLPARYRPTIWARIHHLWWSLVILALWPVSRLFRALEKLSKYA